MSELNIETKNVTTSSQNDMVKKQVTYEDVAQSQPDVDSHSEGCCGGPDTESIESQLEIDPQELEIRASPTRITKMLSDGVKKEMTMTSKKSMLKKQVGSLYFKKKLEAQKIEHGMTRQQKQEFVKMILEQHNNLDLSKYDQYKGTFEIFANDMFNFDTIFTKNLQLLEQPDRISPRKTMETKFQLQSKSPPGEMHAGSLISPRMTAEQLQIAIKALPPNATEEIPERNIERYQELGPIGWHHIMDQILYSKDVPEKLERINKQLRMCFHTSEKKSTKDDPKKKSKSQKVDKKSIKLDPNKRSVTMKPQVGGRNENNTLQTRVSNSRGSQESTLININASEEAQKKNESQTNVVKDLLKMDKNAVMGDFSSLITAKEETIENPEPSHPKQRQGMPAQNESPGKKPQGIKATKTQSKKVEVSKQTPKQQKSKISFQKEIKILDNGGDQEAAEIRLMSEQRQPKLSFVKIDDPNPAKQSVRQHNQQFQQDPQSRSQIPAQNSYQAVEHRRTSPKKTFESLDISDMRNRNLSQLSEYVSNQASKKETINIVKQLQAQQKHNTISHNQHLPHPATEKRRLDELQISAEGQIKNFYTKGMDLDSAGLGRSTDGEVTRTPSRKMDSNHQQFRALTGTLALESPAGQDFDASQIILASNFDDEFDLNMIAQPINSLEQGEFEIKQRKESLRGGQRKLFSRRNKSQGRNGGAFRQVRPSLLIPKDADSVGAEMILDRGERVLSEYQNLNLPYISNKAGGIHVDIDSVKQGQRRGSRLPQPIFNKLGGKVALSKTNYVSPRFPNAEPSIFQTFALQGSRGSNRQNRQDRQDRQATQTQPSVSALHERRISTDAKNTNAQSYDKNLKINISQTAAPVQSNEDDLNRKVSISSPQQNQTTHEKTYDASSQMNHTTMNSQINHECCPVCKQPSPSPHREAQQKMIMNSAQRDEYESVKLSSLASDNLNESPTQLRQPDMNLQGSAHSDIQFTNDFKKKYKKYFNNQQDSKNQHELATQLGEHDYFTKLVLSTFGRNNRRLSYQKFAENKTQRARFVHVPLKTTSHANQTMPASAIENRLQYDRDFSKGMMQQDEYPFPNASNMSQQYATFQRISPRINIDGYMASVQAKKAKKQNTFVSVPSYQ